MVPAETAEPVSAESEPPIMVALGETLNHVLVPVSLGSAISPCLLPTT
jgi:hypothetical protein